jgi:type III secretion protein V
MRRLVMRGELELAVLSFRELAGEYNLQAVGTISLTDITHRRAPSGAPVTSMATAS